MKLVWQERRSGQRLMLRLDDDTDVEVGAVRRTPRGYDALAKTNTYDPGRAQKDFATIEEAKAFVEEFHPWDLFGGDLDLEVEPEVETVPAEASSPATEQSAQAAEPAEASAPAAEQSAQAAEPVEASSPATEQPAQAAEPAEAAAPAAEQSAQAAEPAEDLMSAGGEAGETVVPVEASAPAEQESSRNAVPAEVPALKEDSASRPAVETTRPQKRSWQFWKRG